VVHHIHWLSSLDRNGPSRRLVTRIATSVVESEFRNGLAILRVPWQRLNVRDSLSCEVFYRPLVQYAAGISYGWGLLEGISIDLPSQILLSGDFNGLQRAMSRDSGDQCGNGQQSGAEGFHNDLRLEN